MLVLGRKAGERIVVPHCDLLVTVIAIEGNTVRLGFSAPEALAVYREEVWEQVWPKTQGQQRARGSKADHNGATPRD